MQVLQTPTFKRQVKKLHSNQKLELDKAIRDIISSPNIGELKKGDLSGIRVYKFKMISQLTLIAYEVPDQKEKTLILMALGTHENFYRDLKKQR